MELNQQQRAAAEHGDEPLLIVAGAGTGKTMTLAHRVAALIRRGVDPQRILLLTFTRRAAAEMTRRVEGLCGAGSARVWGGTFHAVASRLLRAHAEAAGLPRDFTIVDRGDAEDLVGLCRAELGLGGGERRFPKKETCLEIYSRVVNAGEPLEVALATRFPWCRAAEGGLRELFRAFVDRKAAQGVLDYDDLLLFWRGLLGDAAVGDALRARFDHVLCDEYQDTNVLQADILAGLRPDGRGLTVVGDDAQSIYSFRAATVENILRFPERFPGAVLVKLEENYRSTAPLLAASNRVIALAARRHEKELTTRKEGGDRPLLVTCFDEGEQTAYVVRSVLAQREQGVELRRQAVLFRTAHHSLDLEVELARRAIPFHKYGGLKFVEAAHVKDLVAVLRLLENPRDRSAGLRALLLVPGVGPRRAARLLDDLDAAGGRFAAWAAAPPPGVGETFPVFAALLGELSRTRLPAAEEVARVRRFLAPLVEARYDAAPARLADLEQIEGLAGRAGSRAELLTDLALDPPASTQDLAGPPTLDDDYLVLSTIHSAKGLEWDAVYVLHAADGNIPSDLSTGSSEEIEEELRLFYVALSRARRHLAVLFPLRYHGPGLSDRHTYAQLTRFLPPAVRALFDERDGAPPGSPPRAEPEIGRAATDIRKGIRDLW